MSNDTDQISHWLEQLKQGDREVISHLLNYCFSDLVNAARRRMQGLSRRGSDEEDIALSAFKSFCRVAEQDGFDHLSDYHDLWQILLTITARKVIDKRRERGALRRGGKVHRVESNLEDTDVLDDVSSDEPQPEIAIELREELERVIESLPEEKYQYQTILRMKLEERTHKDIAAAIGKDERTVERRWKAIRRMLNDGDE